MALHWGERQVAIEGIRDISDTGISVYVDAEMAAGEKVGVAYAGSAVRLEVFGIVAWCSRRDAGTGAPSCGGTHVVGIELLASSILSSAILQAGDGIPVARSRPAR